MSYLIAHVCFETRAPVEQLYPVNCMDSRIKPGDEVVVRMKNDSLRWAVVRDLNFLNWNCSNTILCLSSEATFSDGHVMNIPEGCHRRIHGLLSPHQLGVKLHGSGWSWRRTGSSQWAMTYVGRNTTNTALILMRKNGIDVQILFGHDRHTDPDYVPMSVSFMDGPYVRQTLKGTGDNVFERTWSFAQAFMADGTGLLSMLDHVPASKSPPMPPPNARGVEGDLYAAISGSGDPVYLGDGIWLSSDGGTHDWGR